MLSIEYGRLKAPALIANQSGGDFGTRSRVDRSLTPTEEFSMNLPNVLARVLVLLLIAPPAQ